MNPAEVRAHLNHTLERTDFRGLGEKYEGKVRDCYLPGDGRRIIVVTDRISAFDVVLGTIPTKGQVLNQIAAHWFRATAGIAPNHMMEVPDPNVMVARECRPLAAEFVMRGYLTGVTSTSIWSAYRQGERSFCGHSLPEGMKKNEPLPEPILTPSTKAPKGGHDISVSAAELLETTSIDRATFERAESMARALFAFGQAEARRRGLILADTKYEIGVDANGTMMVIDEIHTPDSSRYWFAEDYEERLSQGQEPRSLDKEFVRRWMAEEHSYTGEGPPPPLSDEIRVEAAMRYAQTFELITGTSFTADFSKQPLARIASNLGIES